MKSTNTLLAAWENTLTLLGDRPAIFNPSGDVDRTFRETDEKARDFESRLEHVETGNVVAVQIGNHVDWPAIFVACLRRGLIVLPLEPSVGERQRDTVFETCSVVAAVNAAPAGTSGVGEIQIQPMETSAAKTQPSIEVNRHSPGATSLLKLTSGTTAAPRAIRFRSEQLLADCEQICETMGISARDLNFALIPISHSYGFSNLLTPLIVRGVPMVLSQDRTPRAVLADLARTKATVLPATPVFYQSFCEMENWPPLPALRLCISAGAPLPLVVARRFRTKFGLPIHTFYGASECGGICFDRDAANEIEGFVGSPMNNVQVEILDPHNHASQARVLTRAAGDGYFPESDSAKLGKGAFVPDDLLTPAANGFKIVGRISDMINVAGKKVNPAEVEAHLRRCDGVRDVVVFGRKSGWRNEEVAACVVVDSGVREKDLLGFARRELNPWQVPKQIFVVDAIPATERGKISRRDLAKRFRS